MAVEIAAEPLYFSRRLAETRRAQQLAASIQFDLARHNLSDDELEDIVNEFAGSGRQTGWGLSEVFTDLVSKEPKRVPVDDIKSLQTNLVNRGYMPPGTEPSGEWGPEWYGAFRRFDRDANDLQRSGRSWGSAPLQAGLNAIASTLPSGVWQNIVGWAKGFAEQTPETLERVGALGGAVGGAAIGTAIAPGPGTAIGAAVGGIAGFVGDLISDDPEEGDQSTGAAILDALTPWEEYSDGNWNRFWEDVGYVSSAVALIGGVKMGAAGASAVARGIPGGLASKAAFTPGAVGTGELGLMGTLGRWGVQKVAPGSFGSMAARTIERVSPMAWATRVPALKATNKLYTGLASASLGIHTTAGLGQESSRLNDDLRLRAQAAQQRAAEEGRELTQEEKGLVDAAREGVAAGTIEKAILKEDIRAGEGFDFLPGVELPFQLDELPAFVDLAAFMFWPERFFPFAKGTLASSARKVMGSERRLQPYVEFLMSRDKLTFSQARATAKEIVSPDVDTWLRLDLGVKEEVASELKRRNVLPTEDRFLDAAEDLTRSTIRRIKEGDEELLKRVLSHSEGREFRLLAHLEETTAPGRGGAAALREYDEALGLAQKAERTAKDALYVEAGDGLLIKSADRTFPADARLPGGGVMRDATTGRIPRGKVKEGATPPVDRAVIEKQAEQLEKQVAKLKRDAFKNGVSPIDGQRMLDEARRLERDVLTLRNSIRGGTPRLRSIDEYRFMPARKDYVTRREYFELRRTYKEMRDEVTRTAKKGLDTQEHQTARSQLESWLLDQKERGILPGHIADKGMGSRPTTKVSDWLEGRARKAADEVVVPDGVMAGRLDELGYKMVLTGQDVLNPLELRQFMELGGVGDYARRTHLFDTLGVRPDKVLDEDIWKYRQAAERSELQDALDRHGIAAAAQDVQRRLYTRLHAINHEGVILGPAVFRNAGDTLQGRAHLYRVDVRSLKPADIENALDDLVGMTPEVAKDLFGALRRGATFGGEVKLLHPGQSAQIIGRAMRVNGLAGFSDAIRTWHMKDPFEWKQNRFTKDWTYKPSARFARSAPRRVVNDQVKDLVKTTKLTKQQADLAMLRFDAMADGAVRAGAFETVDDFYRSFNVESAAKWAEESLDGLEGVRVLMKQHESSFLPGVKGKDAKGRITSKSRIVEKDFKRLTELLGRYEDSPLWYGESAQKIRAVFGGRKVKVAGELVDLDDFVARVIAVTSGGQQPAPNLTIALKAVQDYIESGGKLRYTDASPWKPGRAKELVNEVFEGKVPDSPKFGPFYHALRGDLDAVVQDRRMDFMFGFFKKDKDGKWISAATPEEQSFARNEIRRLAQETGLKPAVVQERMWVAFVDYFDDLARRARKSGKKQDAEAFESIAKGVTDSADFGALLGRPKYADLAEQILSREKGYMGVFFKRFEEDVLGATIFGDDMQTIIRMFSDGDFATLTHEQGHLLRLLMPKDLSAKLEQYFKVRPASEILPPVTPHAGEFAGLKGGTWKKAWRRIFNDTKNPEIGGGTWNPRTGEVLEGGTPKAHFSGVEEETALRISADVSAEEFRKQVRAFVKSREEQLRDPRLHVGFWNDGKGTIHVDVSARVRAFEDADDLGKQFKQEATFDLETLRETPVADWSVRQEEAFADTFERYLAGKFQPPKEFEGVFAYLKGTMGGLYAKVRGVSDIHPEVRATLDEWLKDSMYLKPVKAGEGARRAVASSQVLGGAAAGAAVGAYEGRHDGVFDDDMLHGAAMGGLGGLGLRHAAGKTYGYLPDGLTRLNTALRYTLSFTFDAGRYMEQNTIAMAKYSLPPMFSPKRYMTSGREFKSPFSHGTVAGDEAWDHAVRFWDELNGTSYFHNIDDIDRRMYQAGLLGFQPRNWEAAQAFQLYQRGWDVGKIKDAVSEIGRYGVGRSAAEKSANFVFFPFSFSKKYLETLGDFILGAPGRNLLLTEGLRRYRESSLDEKWNSFVQDHAPILEQLWRVNNLAFGLSPGRFFLEGLGDNRTVTGNVAHILSAFFVPSGAVTPLAQAAGTAGDLGVNAFMPVVLTGESIDRLGGVDSFADVVTRYIPFTRELEDYFRGVTEQKAALFEGRTPWSQLSEYAGAQKEAKARYAPLATAMGYSSVDGYLQSDVGAPARAELDALERELQLKYPTGFRLSTEITNEAAVTDAQMLEILENPTPSAAEQRIIEMREAENAMEQVSQLVDIPAFDSLLAQRIREMAAEHADDRRFQELYSTFFERTYGPIRRVA